MATNQASVPESGIRNHRVEFVREDELGVTPSDPDWEAFSDTLQTALVWTADAQVEAQRGVGDPDPQGFFAGPEDHTATIEYSLQKFFVDGSGDPLDASGDALVRNELNDVPNSHTVVDRADHGDARTYVVLKGARPNIDEIAGDPGSGLPMVVTLAYETKKGRSYTLNQPPAGGSALDVVSTSADDDTQTLVLEGDDGTTEDVTLTGDTAVTTDSTFDSLDAAELDSETEGDVIISVSGGDELARINGAEHYNGIEGDLGVPTTGAGSHAGEVGESYEIFLDDYISKGDGDLAAEVRSATFSVDNGYEKAGVMGSKQQAIHAGQREITFEATVAGNYESHEAMRDHLAGNNFDLVWDLDGGSLTFEDAVYTEAGDVGPEAGSVVSELDVTFQAEGLSVNNS